MDSDSWDPRKDGFVAGEAPVVVLKGDPTPPGALILDMESIEAAADISLGRNLREEIRQAVENYLMETTLEERQPAVPEVREQLQHTCNTMRSALQKLADFRNNEDPALIAAMTETLHRGDVSNHEIVVAREVLRRLAESAEAAEKEIASQGGRPRQQARERLIGKLKSVLASAGAPTEVTFDPYSEEARGSIIDLSWSILTQIGGSTDGLTPACKRAKPARG